MPLPKGIPSPAGQDHISTVQQLKLPLKDKTAKFGSSAIKRSMSAWAMSNSPEGKKMPFQKEALGQMKPASAAAG